MTGDDVKQRVAAEFHGALTTGDRDRLRAVLTPDVVWVLPGDNAVSGAAEGADAVIGRAELIASYGLTFTLERVLYSRDSMALSLHNTASRDDAVLDEYLATVCTLRDGRISAIETYLSDVPGMNRFFVPLPA